MLKFFVYDGQSHRVSINTPEIMLIREFNDLYKNDKSPKKKLVNKQITYIQLALAWDSPYSQYSELERHNEALKDSGLTQEQFNDKNFRAACRKFIELQDSNKSIKLLKAARSATDQFIDYFENIVDLNERDNNGKPIFTADKVMKEVSQLSKVHQELLTLENQVKKEITEQSQIRAGAVEGFEDYNE